LEVAVVRVVRIDLGAEVGVRAREVHGALALDVGGPVQHLELRGPEALQGLVVSVYLLLRK
jgi:hypothetical protein